MPARLLALEPRVRGRIGVDLDPVDVTTDEGALRLRSFVWPGQEGRLERLDRAIEAVRREPPKLVRGDLVERCRRCSPPRGRRAHGRLPDRRARLPRRRAVGGGRRGAGRGGPRRRSRPPLDARGRQTASTTTGGCGCRSGRAASRSCSRTPTSTAPGSSGCDHLADQPDAEARPQAARAEAEARRARALRGRGRGPRRGGARRRHRAGRAARRGRDRRGRAARRPLDAAAPGPHDRRLPDGRPAA